MLSTTTVSMIRKFIHKHQFRNRFICTFAALFVVILFSACSIPGKICKTDVSESIARLKRQLNGSRQVLLVIATSASLPSAEVYGFEKCGTEWKPAFAPLRAVIGKRGFAPPGEKREADGRTPSGIFSLKTVFGYAPSGQTRMPYRQALVNDVWIDDPNADDYNQWVKEGETHASSFERMKRDDQLYKYGIIIEYNTSPVIKGFGSAIFFHVWKEKGSPTEGCTALSEQDMLRLFAWLDPGMNPIVVMGMEETLKGFPQ